MILGCFFSLYDLRTVTVILWKLDKPISSAHEFWKLPTEFFNIKSVVLGLPGSLKHVGTLFKFFSLYRLQKYLIWKIASSALRSPIRNTWSKIVRRVPKLFPKLLTWSQMLLLLVLYEQFTSHFFFLTLSSIEILSTEPFISINLNKVSSLTYTRIPPPWILYQACKEV